MKGIILSRDERKTRVTQEGIKQASYRALNTPKPGVVVEVADGINIDATSNGKIVGIELLDASQKVTLDTPLSYEIAAHSTSEWIQSKVKVNTYA